MDVPREVLLRIERVKDSLLPKYGWYPSDPESPRWWGGLGSLEEIAISAVLVQLSRWSSALESLEELRRHGLLRMEELARADQRVVAALIRRSGMPQEKARRLIELARAAAGRPRGICERDVLLSVRGIGKETADSILLFGCNVLTWPASRLSLRVLSRVGMEVRGGYEAWKAAVEGSIPRDLYYYKLMHAGLVSVARAHCSLSDPSCDGCPLSDVCSRRGVRRRTS